MDAVAEDVRARMAAHLRGSRVDEIVTSARVPLASFPLAADPVVSVITVTYGTGPVIVDALAALSRTLAGTPSEVIVVDQPPDGAGRALPAATRLRLLTSGVRIARVDGNYGFGGGNDLGIALARAPIVVLLNPDVIVRPGWVGPLLGALDDPGVGIAAPIMLNPDGTVQEAGQTLDDQAITRPITTRPDSDLSEVTFASAACWALRRADYDEAGGFDPAYHPAYFEDVDLALRMQRLGRRTVVVAASEVVHHHGASTSTRTAQALSQQQVFRHRWSKELAALAG